MLDSEWSRPHVNMNLKNYFPEITFVTTNIIGLAPARSRTRAKKLPLKSTISTYKPKKREQTSTWQ